ncbi:MAG: enolase C-terminal domain-like protein [Candidatus Daviesbacteria bacterium]|nr:enolase C-terminal domain-like protein [Candidatus Daviesbacteria bacterium]
MKIDRIHFQIIPDSKGKDTLEAQMLSDGTSVIASVPTGESTGKNEAKVIPPQKALEKTDWIFSQIKDHDFATLDQFDGLLTTLDGTEDKSNLGGNLIIALSMAFAKLLAKSAGMEVWQLVSKISGAKPSLPLCFFNVIEGGVHGNPPAGGLPFQEYWFIPKTNSPQKSLDEANDFLKLLGDKIKDGYGEVEMGSEGGYTIPSKNAEDGLKIMQEISSNAQFGLDCAATKLENKIDLSYYQLLTTNYNLLAIEDPYSEDDWDGFSKITASLGEKIWIIGDDLTTTNPKRLKMAADKNAVNAVIIKPTQIGTVTETIQAVNLAKSYGWKIVVANRGEETMDTFIADLAVGIGADGLKSGCPLQKERMVKYERLVEIEKTWHI